MKKKRKKPPQNPRPPPPWEWPAFHNKGVSTARRGGLRFAFAAAETATTVSMYTSFLRRH
eukprot:scaffold82388_cov35-Tisochrysis_lutea.AAC.7